MKQISMLMLLILLGDLVAQNITISPDFTGTDIHGNKHNLFEYLDKGMYVWIHTTGKY